MIEMRLTAFLVNLLIGGALAYVWITYGARLYGEVFSKKYWAGLVAICLLSFPISYLESTFNLI
jgi:4-amino-4-deoxy-L-arabinose transferase-like glycosyltransferase